MASGLWPVAYRVLYQRAVLIYNPAAGRNQARRGRIIERALRALERHVGTVEARATDRPHSATRMAREACREGADLILVCGGDGTINEVVNGLA